MDLSAGLTPGGRLAAVAKRLPKRSGTAARLAMLCMAWLLAGCSTNATNFSQFAGFAQYRAAHPPREAPPTEQEQQLLQQFRPRLYLPPGHAGLIDFYRDYIAQGRLTDGTGRWVDAPITQALLNAHKHDPKAVFVHRPDPDVPGRATVFARIDHDTLRSGGVDHALTFLTYHAVFRHSGLVAGLEAWINTLAGLFIDLRDWHQLDHYTAATLVLDAGQRPIALVLQQHNYHHTYVFGGLLPLPVDGRVGVDVALRSNELYPHAAGRVMHRAARFGSPQELRYLMGFGDKPLIAGQDITHGQHEVAYRLDFLPPADAFYTFQGFLGERRRLPGRDGPPGADYNTLPELKSPVAQMLMGFWRAGDVDDLARLDAGYSITRRATNFVQAQTQVFVKAAGLTP